MQSKTISGYLVINWKEGSHRTRKSKPTDLGTYELATPLEIEVEIPDVDVPEIAAKVQVPQPHVQTAVVDSISDEDFPEWSDVCDAQLEEHVGAIQRASSLDEVDALVERLTTRVLLEVDGIVDAENVQAYLEDQAHRLYRDAPRGEA